jgi:adenosylhomocysteine nucleosidase
MTNNIPSSTFRPCHLGVIFALGIESGFLEDSLADKITIRGEGFKAKEGDLHGRRIAIMLSRAGRANAAKAAETLINGHKPTFVLSTGFAGGLSPQLKRNDIVLVNEIMLDSGESIAVAPSPWEEGIEPADICRGKLLTTDRIIRLADEKKSLFETTGAVAVDMETFAVAEVCRRRNIPFFAVRIIHDTADETLPPDIEKLLHQKTEAARIGAAIGALWKRPSSIKDMWALKENSLVAAKKLAEFIADMVKKF